MSHRARIRARDRQRGNCVGLDAIADRGGDFHVAATSTWKSPPRRAIAPSPTRGL
eukprot:gene41051-55493_t